MSLLDAGKEANPWLNQNEKKNSEKESELSKRQGKLSTDKRYPGNLPNQTRPSFKDNLNDPYKRKPNHHDRFPSKPVLVEPK